jgi:uncharacterized protein
VSLLERRNLRVRPGLDDKVLTEWNCMAVAALAESGAALDRPDYRAAAEEVAEFLLGSLRRLDGRWLRSWQAGTARHLAYGSDHAWAVEAFTRLAEATGRRRWIDEASAAADALIELFWDEEAGGFTTAGLDAEALIASPIDTQDGALPSTNSVAAMALLRLGALTGSARYSDTAAAVVEAMAPALAKAPVAFTGMVAAADLLRRGVTEIVVAGDRPDLAAVVSGRYLPSAVMAWGEAYDSPLWEGRSDGRAYVCQNYACRSPVSEPAELGAQLETIHPSVPVIRPS